MTSFAAPKSIPPAPEESKPKRKKHRDWSGATLAFLFGLIGLIGTRLGHLWIGFDVISQFSMQFLFLVLAAVLGMASPRMKGLVASVFFALMIVGYALWPHWVSTGDSKTSALASGEQKLKVASFNTYASNKDYQGIINSVLATEADVVTLIEMEPDKLGVLAGLKQKYPYQFDCNGVDYCHLAILSKFPLTAPEAQSLWDGPPYIRASLGAQFGGLTIFGVHTTRFPHSRAQFAQVNALVKLVETLPGRVVMMGDFNSTPFSRINQTVSQGLGFTRLTQLPTWPASYGFPQLAIDHIFVSTGIRAISDEHIGDNAGSDHFPISMVLAVSPP